MHSRPMRFWAVRTPGSQRGPDPSDALPLRATNKEKLFLSQRVRILKPDTDHSLQLADIARAEVESSAQIKQAL